MSPSILNFGGQTVGTTSNSSGVTLTNHLTVMLNIAAITTSGDFGQTNNCGASIAPGASCLIRVTFSPTMAGTRTGLLTVTDDASTSPQSTGLSGTGALTGLTSIVVSPSAPTVPLGRGQQFSATGYFKNGTVSNLTAAVTWASANSTIAIISNTIGTQGFATSTGRGVVGISASAGGVTGSTSLTVAPPALVSLSIAPVNPSLPLGSPAQFAATGVYTDNSSHLVTSGLTWTSSNLSVATVNQQGLATSLAQGTANITATAGSVSAYSTLTVLPPALVSIAVTPANPIVNQYSTEPFSATGYYTDRSSKTLSGVSWSSSNSLIPITQLGVASANVTGTSTITATLSSISGSTAMTVVPVLVGIKVNPAQPTVSLGLTQQMAAVGYYSDHSTQTLTSGVNWSSSVPSIATVNAQGLVTTVAQGTANITATSGSFSAYTPLTVAPPELLSLNITPQNPSVPAGLTQQFQANGTYSDQSTQDVTSSVVWNSSSTSMATVNSSGLARTSAQGAPTITASTIYFMNGAAYCCVSATTTLNITAPILQSIGIMPKHPTLVPGTTITLGAAEVYSDGSRVDISNSVSFGSSNSAVASVTSSGLLTTVAQGVTTISAYSSTLGMTGTMPVEVYANGQARFAYVGNSNDYTLSLYLIDGTSGQLYPADSFFVGDNMRPQSPVIDPAGKYLYVGAGQSAIGGYSIDPTTGSLASISTPVSASLPHALAMHPSGQYLFSTGNAAVFVYSIGSNGSLTALTSQQAGYPYSMAVDPTGSFVYAMDYSDNVIYGFSFNAQNGALTSMPNSPFPGGPMGGTMVVHPSGSFALVTNPNGPNVYALSIDPASGALTPLGQPVAAQSPCYLTFDVNGNYAYTAFNGGLLPGEISAFSVDTTTGGLTPLASSPFAADHGTCWLAVDPTNQYLYAADGFSNDVMVFAIDSAGSLTLKSSSATGNGPGWVVLVK